MIKAHATDQRAPTDSASGAGHQQIRWRWYHFYFILAFFDLVVILASFVLYHQTLASYETALTGLAALDARQRWITDLRLSVIELNAPGNDVFESRDVAAERQRFNDTQSRLRLLLRRESEFDIDLGQVRDQVERMIEQENRIFAAFEQLQANPEPRDPEAILQQATVSMAAMDRHQADAVGALSDAELLLQREEANLLDEYGAQLQRSAAREKYFLGIVVLILIGVFWYGRKLQRMHEEMLDNEQRAIAERHQRLASVGEVCSAVAHGIRNPLAGITSSAQLALEYGTLDDATALRLNDVLGEARRLDRRITRLLDFARGGKETRARVDLRSVIQQALDELAPGLEAQKIKTEHRAYPQPLVVECNEDEMVQAVIELLANAMDHVESGGSVGVFCEMNAQPDRAVLIVADDGPGIPEEISANVFDLFFTTKSEGTGIGLASVKRTIESHGGSVRAESTPDSGARIVVELPLFPA